MRLDKFLSVTATCSRSEAKAAAKAGKISVDGVVIKDTSFQLDENTANVVYCGKKIEYKQFTYIMLNKPQGYVSSTDDPKQKTVLELLPENFKKLGLFPCGRLDIDTTGLLILTNNGQLAHRLLAPKYHVDKTYFFTCYPPLDESSASALEKGVDIGEKSLTRPASLKYESDGTQGTITVSEGKFHQIKRMFHAVGSEITSLSRVEFAGIPLDEKLKKGEWRFLSKTEEDLLESAGDF
ncbi:MAG: rRNA pseudouridine synthase [Clostridia bacterium]|nr:rRNA pseudouridine synthase [Clostridia bacterium]